MHPDPYDDSNMSDVQTLVMSLNKKQFFYQWDGVSLNEFEQRVFADVALVDGTSVVELLEEDNESVFGLE